MTLHDEWTTSVEAAERAISENPNDGDAWVALAMARIRDEDWNGALDAAERAHAMDTSVDIGKMLAFLRGTAQRGEF